MPIDKSAIKLVVVGFVAAFLSVLFLVRQPATTTLLVPLIFFLPGHAVLAAALPTQLIGLPRIVCSVGLSLAIVVLSGLGLHFLHAMSRPGWLAALIAITAIGYAVAVIRHAAVIPSLRPLSFAWNFSPRDASFYSVSLAAVTLAFIIAATAGRQHQEFHFTEFWMLPDRADEVGTVELGVNNVEAKATSYDLELMLDGRLIGAWRTIHLNKGETWTWTIDLPAPARSRRLEAWLFKDGDHGTVYRRVWLAAGEPR